MPTGGAARIIYCLCERHDCRNLLEIVIRSSDRWGRDAAMRPDECFSHYFSRASYINYGGIASSAEIKCAYSRVISNRNGNCEQARMLVYMRSHFSMYKRSSALITFPSQLYCTCTFGTTERANTVAREERELFTAQSRSDRQFLLYYYSDSLL